MTSLLLIAALLLCVASVSLLLVLLKRTSPAPLLALASRLDALEKAQERTERAVRDEVGLSREELSKATREQRQELAEAFRTFGASVVERMTEAAGSQKGQLESFSAQLAAFAKASGERLDAARLEAATTAKQLREEVVASLGSVAEMIAKTMGELAAAQKAQLESFAAQLAALTKTSGDKLEGVRAESATAGAQLRQEVVATLTSISEAMTGTLRELGAAQKSQLDRFSTQIAASTQTSGEKLDGMRSESAAGAKLLREEVVAALHRIMEVTTRTMGELANTQKAQLETMSAAIAKLVESNERKLEALRVAVESKLESIQIDNAKQLDQMRQTVDEKLQGTLEKRLGESFKQVSERLEQVHKGLGEMQTLATGVGDLKKVLTNVKTRGTWGEVQLGAMLEQVLTPDQFGRNVATKDGGERVEFAIKLPGQGTEKEEIVWLPIDAKFPVEDYQRLIEAQERADVEAVEAAGKQLENRVKASAKEVCDKYVSPPKTTDFAILFLPTEGLFAEVIRRPGLTDVIQRESRVAIAGPTTLGALLNSLQIGFRTLAIQERSSEVWKLLAAVKTEWTKYGDVLEAVQKKLHQASDTIEKAQARSRAVGRKLKDVQALPVAEAHAFLPLQIAEDGADPEADDGDRVQ